MNFRWYSVLVLAAFFSLTYATCECNSDNGRKAARIAPFSLESPSLGNKVLDLAEATSQLLADESGLPHKMAMVYVSMKKGYSSAGNETDPVNAALSVGYEALIRLLSGSRNKIPLLDSRMKQLNISRGDKRLAQIAMKTLMKFKPNNMEPYGPINPPSKMYDASCSSIKEADKWQPQCIQMKPGAMCMTQKVPFLPLRNASLVSFGGKRSVDILTKYLPKAPSYNGSMVELPFNYSNKFSAQYKRVLATSATLNDHRKFQAEFFKPNAAWLVYNVALEEAIVRALSPEDSIKLMAVVASATRDAAVSGVTTKMRYNLARPISIIQCAWGNREEPAWLGPYMGVGKGKLSAWRSYLTTPPHPSYVSGHATVCAAGMAAMKTFFKEDIMRGPNCPVSKKGTSLVEPRIEKGAPGYIAGVTDVPNKGPWTKGYSPAKDTKLCWQSFTDFSVMLAESREFGGIHIPVDNWNGMELGKRVAEFASMNSEES